MTTLKAAKKFISEDKVEQALDYLHDLIAQNSGLQEFENELLLLKGRFTSWKRDTRLDITEKETLDITIQKIRWNTLEMIDVITAKEAAIQPANNLFAAYIEPLHNKLLIVHDNWLSSFLHYRETIEKAEEMDPEQFLSLLEKDSLYSAKGRLDVKIQLELVPKKEEIMEYLWAVKDYMQFSETLEPVYISAGENPKVGEIKKSLMMLNYVRQRLYDSLNKLIKEDQIKTINLSNKEKFIYRIDQLVIHLHEKYEAVEKVFQKLRTGV